MKHLYTYFRKYRLQAVLAPLFKMMEALMDLFVPLVVADLIDIGIAGNDMHYILSRIVILVVLAALSLGFSFTAQYFSARAAVGFACDVREGLFEHMYSLSLSQTEKIGTDTLMTRLTSDVNQIQTGLNMALRLLLRSPFIVFGSMIMAFTVDVKAALVFCVAIPVLLVFVLGVMLVSIPMFRTIQAKLDRLTRLTRENLTGVRVIRAFAKERKTVQDFDEANDALMSFSMKTGRISALLNPVTFLIVNLATAGLIYIGAIRVNCGALGQGQVIALYNYMAQMIVELIKLSSLMITINRALASAGRVSDIFAIEPDMAYGTETVETEEHGTVKFDHVSFRYSDHAKDAVSDISFEVKPGETIGIIGGTGSGKTTLVSLLERFYDACEGTVFLDGHDIKEYSRSQLHGTVCSVLQKSVLFAGTIRDNMKMAKADATDEEIHAALNIAQADEFVTGKEGGLDYMLEQGGKNLSGGQKQRLSIARAVLARPEILILDDSASALDFATDAKLRQAIASLKGCTVFMISQRIGTVKNCDRILVMDRGNLVGNDTHEKLLEHCEIYAQIYESQFPKEAEA